MELNQEQIENVKPFISRITVSKVANLGNYENRKVEISVTLSAAESVGTILTEIESIIDDFNCLKDLDKYALTRARRELAKPIEEMTDFYKERIADYEKTVAKYEALEKRRAKAIEKLNKFGGVTEFRDAKEKWEDDG